MIPLDERLEILTQQIVRAKIYYDLWWFSVGELTKPQILDTLNDFPDFFRFDAHAHFVSMIVHCAVVWDKGADTISLPRIANEILDSTRFPSHSEVSAEISALEAAASGILTIRHRAIAHRSRLDNYRKVFEDTGIIPNQLPVMMLDWLVATNRLRQIQGLATEDFRDLPLTDLQGVIHALGGPDLRPSDALEDMFKG